MPRKRGVNVLNDKLQEEFSFLTKRKSDSDIRCSVCGSEFNISHGGKADILVHLKSSKHKKALSAASTSKSVTNFFNSDTVSKTDLHIAACEGVWAYHVINSNYSFRSTDCASKIIRICFGMMPKFSCARTKCESIVTNVFSPFILQELQKDLNDSHFVTLMTDASNHGNIKMFPVLVRYFSEKDGIKVRILDLTSQDGEKSDTIVNLLKASTEKFNLSEKLAAFVGDNAPCNFGNRERTGTENTFYKLNQLYPGLIGIGCAAHIVHNTLKRACDKMPFDVEMIVCKIYSHFYLTTVRVAVLKQFCDAVKIEYQKVLGYSKTRFLDLLKAVSSILRIFDALKKYFLEDPSSPNSLKMFFKDSMAQIWIIFLRDQAALFNRTVKQIEGDYISAVEIGSALNEFIESLEERRNSNFLSTAVKNEIEKVAVDDNTVSSERVLMTTEAFYDTCIDYVGKWSSQFDHIMIFAWSALDQVPDWVFIEASAKYIAKQQRFDLASYDTALFDEYTYLKKFATVDKIQSWEENSIAIDKRWVECFQHFAKKDVPYNHMLRIVAYILCLPGTSAPVERVFSIINEIWSTDKTQLKIETLKHIVYTKYNIKLTCLEFFDFLKTQPNLLKLIGSNDKYSFKNSGTTE